MYEFSQIHIKLSKEIVIVYVLLQTELIYINKK